MKLKPSLIFALIFALLLIILSWYQPAFPGQCTAQYLLVMPGTPLEDIELYLELHPNCKLTTIDYRLYFKCKVCQRKEIEVDEDDKKIIQNQ